MPRAVPETAPETEPQPSNGEAAADFSSGLRRQRLAMVGLVLLALAVRLTILFAANTYELGRNDDGRISGETTNIARAIVEGRGFSSALNGVNPGPTAWMAPAYPYFVALVFRFLGFFTKPAIIAILIIQSLFSALTVVPILGIAGYTVGRRAGWLAAWAWSVFPWFSKWSVTWVWEMSLSAFLLSLLFWYALSLRQDSRLKAWCGFGALFGFALLVNPALAAFLPVALAWCCHEMYLAQKDWLKPAVVSVLACAVVISPWLVRNRLVFGRWVFLRSNFGFELALGNYHDSNGRGWGGGHPSGNPKEFQKYVKMGEIAYNDARQREALEFIKEYPGEFMSLNAKRFVYFWDGSAMDYFSPSAWYWFPSSFAVLSFLVLPGLLVTHRRKLHGWPMFFGVLLLYPFPYYLTSNQVRFRHAIEPLMLLLIAFAAVAAAEWLWGLRAVPRQAGLGEAQASE